MTAITRLDYVHLSISSNSWYAKQGFTKVNIRWLTLTHSETKIKEILTYTYQ